MTKADSMRNQHQLRIVTGKERPNPRFIGIRYIRTPLHTSYRFSFCCCMQMTSTSHPPSTAASAMRRTRGSKGYQSKVIIPTCMGDIQRHSFPNRTTLERTTTCANPFPCVLFASVVNEVHPQLPDNKARSL